MAVADGALRIDSERTRRHILRAARELSREAGYAHVRMSDIAERVGCARATVYNHFANRDELLEALCSDYLAGYLDIQDRIADWAAPGSSVFAVLRETVAEELRWRVANGDLRDALDSAKRLRKDFYVQGDERIDAVLLAWFGDIHRASQRQGLLRPGLDLAFATRATYAMIDHVVAGFPVETPADELDVAADQVAKLQWHALYLGDPEQAPPFDSLGPLRSARHDVGHAEQSPGTSRASSAKAASGSTVASSPAAATT